jgi:hypothetical protein
VEVAGRSGGKVWGLGLRSERNGEVVAEGVDYDDDCLVECLGMPAPLLRIARYVRARRVDRGDGALRLEVEDEFGEEEAAGEEIDADYMEYSELLAGALSSSAWPGRTRST